MPEGAANELLGQLSAAQYARFSALLDESLDMSGAQRDAWLAALNLEDPAVTAALREFFIAQQALAEDFLEPVVPLLRGLAGIPPTEIGLIGKHYGPYRVLSLLGHGGMGSVWLAERVDGLFTRQVALKLIHPALLGRVSTERFTREREILASLNHPNIARLSDAGFADDGQPFIALEYIAGTPLNAYCDSNRLSLRRRLELFRQVLNAVQYAHAHLVIHRDLKPSNILVSAEGQIHLLDFGIAKLLTEGEARETELTQIGGRALTPDYAAPEQIAGLPISISADIYSLGVMLYELLSGERPYRLERETRGALEDAILRKDPPPPSRLAPSQTAADHRDTTAQKLQRALRGDLDTIVLKSLKKSPAERYATANAFGEDIERYLRGDVVLAQRDSVWYRSVKFARRHRLAIAVAGILVLTLLGGLAATTYEAKLAAVQRDAAIQAQFRSLTQTAAARLGNADVPSALGMILEVLPHRGMQGNYAPEALSVFQQARATDAQILALTGHANRVRSVAFSPDGRKLVTASWDKSARIWDVASGVEIGRLEGHSDRVWTAAFSPDGKLLVTASHDKTARVWDATTLREIMQLNGHSNRVSSAEFSPDGRYIVTSSYDKTARIWDAVTGREIQILSGHGDMVVNAAYSPDGKHIVTASHDKTARIWDSATGRQISVLSGHSDWVSTAAYSPDGQQILSASYDKTAAIWDAASGRQIRLLSGHTDRLWSANFSPDGLRVATASYDKTARIWDAASGREIAKLIGHSAEVSGAVFSPDGQRLATAAYDRTARLWDASAGHQLVVLDGHTEPVASATFSPDGRRVVTGSYDKSARIWDAASGRELLRLLGHTDQVVSAEYSPDGQRVVTTSPDTTARIWDASSGKELMQLKGHSDQVVSASFSPDGRRVATGSLDKTARVWDTVSGKELLQITATDLVETVDFSPDGKRIVTALHDKTARVWDAQSGRELVVLSGHTERVESAAYSADGRRIVTAAADRSARIWHADSGRFIASLLGHGDLVEIAAFSNDGTHIVTASDDKTARIWDAASGDDLMVLSGHTDRLWFAAFSPDGSRVVTASDDKTARIWDAHAAPLAAQIGWAEAAQFDPLPSSERFQLGLPAMQDIRSWPGDASPCDQLAGAPYDPERLAPGSNSEQIVADVAVAACRSTSNGGDASARGTYERGRALVASNRSAEARSEFEQALQRHYRVAQVDLARLLSLPAAGMLDAPRAISLLQQSWREGVPIAGFELGKIYEQRSAADGVLAWQWYQKAAAAGEPNALARMARREDDAALSAAQPAIRRAHLLEAFKFYAAAAEHARIEDWPDEAWRNWRYRRASLARLLAREGMMDEVADAYYRVK